MNILLIDDHPLVLICNQTFLAAMFPSAQIVGLTHIQDIGELEEEFAADLIVSDLIMPEVSQRHVFDSLRHRFPQASTVFLSSEDQSSALAEEIRSAGCLYIQKSTPTGLISTQIGQFYELGRGDKHLHQTDFEGLLSDAGFGKLNEAHVQVMECLLQGLTIQDIAEHLGVSVHTIVSRTRRAYKLLGASNQAMAVNYYLRLKRYRQFIQQ